MSPKSVFKTLLGTSLAGTAGVAAYALIVRPWHRRWGASPDEAAKTLPGDDRVPKPRLTATHAVTIDATPEQVWPWIVQLGAGRGGFYSYDWIENLMGLDVQTADRILPQFQALAVGDTVPLLPSGEGLPVAALEPGRMLLLHLRADRNTEGAFRVEDSHPEAFFATSWGFYLEPLDGGRTRLIERFRMDWKLTSWPPQLLSFRSVLEPGSFIMERKMLLGIKERAEAATRPDEAKGKRAKRTKNTPPDAPPPSKNANP